MATRGHVIQITNCVRWEENACVCVSMSPCCSVTHILALLSGVDVHEAEEDCTTEATTPTSFEPIDQSRGSTAEMEESPRQEVAPSQGEVGPAAEDAGTVTDASLQEEGPRPTDGERAETERDSEKGEESGSDTRPGSQSVDELLADWREDLEAFQQMERDEL